MTLSQLLESKFRGDIRFRGQAYVEAERVCITRVTPDQVFAVVRDGVEYETQLSRHENELRMFCNCSHGAQQDIACKHLWATILAVDAGNYLSGLPTSKHIPPFADKSSPSPELEDDDDWDDDVTGLVLPAGSKRITRRRKESETRLREWESRLETLKNELAGSDSTPSTTPREREIFYLIDVEHSREDGQLVLEISQRQQRTNGQWGKLKPLKLRPGKLAEVEEAEDRRILAYLLGGTAERSNWHAQQAAFQSSAHRFRLPYELCELILPMMCQTTRVRLHSDAGQSGSALTWDDAPPWQLSICIARRAEDGKWCLKGQLRRGDSLLPLGETVLIVPGGLVLTRTRIARVEDFGPKQWVDLVLRDDALAVSDGEEEELVDRLLDMPMVPLLDLPDHLRLEEVCPEPVPRLLIHSPGHARWHKERLRGQVHFDYLGTSIRATSVQSAIIQRDHRRCILRNRESEERAWSQLQRHGFRRLLDQRRGNCDVDIAARDLGLAVRAIIGYGWQIRAEGQHVRQPGELQFRIKSRIDWFELHANVDFEGQSVAFPELLSALARGNSTVRLDDGSFGILPEEWFERYALLAGLGVTDGDHVRFAGNQVGLLDALLAAQESVDYDERFRELRDKLKSFSGITAVGEPTGFRGELRGYQREGLGWLKFLEDFRFGGCLADDMGLGKTVQMLALFQNRHARQSKRLPSLIVVPKSLLFNWLQEIDRFTPNLKALEYAGVDRKSLREDFRKFDLILTTYGTLRRDVMELKDVQFDYVVLDEAQTIKNSGSQVAKASRLLQSNFRVALSGTPIENHIGDLWSIFEFLNPGILGRSSVFKMFADDGEVGESRRLLAQGLRPFILRRTKQQVANDLPEKVEQTIYCKMGEDQERLYLEMRDHYRESLLGIVETQGLAKSKMHVLEALLRLRQAACHPALLDKQRRDESSAKLDVLCPHLEELIEEGHKTLVFSQFTSMLSIVKEHLDRRGIVYEYLDGQTRRRQNVVEHFQNDPECPVFLISLKAGGLGLNLTAADYVFLLDPWWNPAVESQAIDRAHRVGQTRPVFAYRLICRDTVEEKITDLQKHKRGLADAILQENTSLIKNLTADDLRQLLS